MFVSVVLLGCEDSVIVEAFKEVLSMLDEVCIFGVFFCAVGWYNNMYFSNPERFC